MNPGSAVLRGRRVLVVEDEVLVSMMLDNLLTSAGAVVIDPVGTTTKALALIEQDLIHCAVLDVKLMDGVRCQSPRRWRRVASRSWLRRAIAQR
jgi:DNA-binding response OmpR family regulator